MSRCLGLEVMLGIAVTACGASSPAHAPTAGAARADRDEPDDLAYYALVGLPRQSFIVPAAGNGSVKLGEAWIGLEQAPYALITEGERVELLSPLAGADIPEMKDWDEPMGTVRQHLTRGRRGEVEAAFSLALEVPSRLDGGLFPAQRRAVLVVSVDPFQACDPSGDRMAKQLVVRQRGCFLEPERCDDERTVAPGPDGTYSIGPVRASVAVVCLPVVHAL
jgi:hypothetical protein